MEKLLDVILLTHNNLDNTRICIDRLYKYTSDFNLIIVDNNSIDGTIEYLKNIDEENIFIHFSPKNLGCVNGRNFAYSFSKNSEYICFLDNDQFVLDGWQESYISYIIKGYDIIGFEGWKMRDNFIPYKKSSKGEEYNYVGCGGMFLKRSVINDIGLFDSQYNPMYYEDPDFCWRAYDKGYKICWNACQRIFHKPHKLLNSERRLYFNKSLNIFRKKWKGRELPKLSYSI